MAVLVSAMSSATRRSASAVAVSTDVRTRSSMPARSSPIPIEAIPRIPTDSARPTYSSRSSTGRRSTSCARVGSITRTASRTTAEPSTRTRARRRRESSDPVSPDPVSSGRPPFDSMASGRVSPRSSCRVMGAPYRGPPTDFPGGGSRRRLCDNRRPMSPPIAPTHRLRADLEALAERLDALRFGLGGHDAVRRQALRDRTVWAIRGHLQPRLAAPRAPLLVAVFGPTGSGKSTLVNALAGMVVSRPGAVRPTTEQAVVWCHREAELPDALHSTGPVARVDSSDPLLARLTLVDTPDIDSYATAHRAQTERILAIADAVIYVTTPQRYGDEVPWSFLRTLAERRVPLLVVANRMTRSAAGAVTDLASLLRAEGVKSIAGTDEVFEIREQRLVDGVLPRPAVRTVRVQLEGLSIAHERAVRRTLDGAIAAVTSAAGAVASEVRLQHAEADALRDGVRAAYRREADSFEAPVPAGGLVRGELVRGELVDRWQRLVGVPDLVRAGSRRARRARGPRSPRTPVDHSAARTVEREARAQLVELVMSRIRRAVDAACHGWDLDPAGRELLEDRLRRPGPDTRGRAEREIDDWYEGLVVLVEERGRPRRRVGRSPTEDVDAAAAVLLLLSVFVSTPGPTGAESEVPVGAAAQQAALEHVFGGAAARLLADRARRDLEDRVSSVLSHDAERFIASVDAEVDDPSVAGEIELGVGAVRATWEEMRRAAAV